MKFINKVILLLTISLMLSSNLAFCATKHETSPPPKPRTEREFYLTLCQEDLGKIQTFLHDNRVLIQNRFYDKQKLMIIETYATKDNTYVMMLGIVSSGKVCILEEGFMYHDLRGLGI